MNGWKAKNEGGYFLTKHQPCPFGTLAATEHFDAQRRDRHPKISGSLCRPSRSLQMCPLWSTGRWQRNSGRKVVGWVCYMTTGVLVGCVCAIPKPVVSKGGDRYPQISAKHVQFEFSLRLPNGIATSHDLIYCKWQFRIGESLPNEQILGKVGGCCDLVHDFSTD